MIRNLSITILVDNQVNKANLQSEHGLSLWIEADDRRILFDAGQSDMLIPNAEALGIDLRTADTLILSHGHYDHTGGVAAVLDLNPTIAVYCHPCIFMPRYSRQADGTLKAIGINKKSSDALHRTFDTIHWITKPSQLSDNIGITGPISRVTKFEDTGGAFYLDIEAARPDLIYDDLSLWIKTAQGIFVITGCCHSGIVNTLCQISNQLNKEKIVSVIGGLHLLHASQMRIEKTFEYLQMAGLRQVVPCHCTGEQVELDMKKRLEKIVTPGMCGLKISVP